MKKDIKEILDSITPDTTIEEVLAYCDTAEDLDLILKSIPAPDSSSVLLSDKLKQRAQRVATIAKEFNGEVTMCHLQRVLEISFPKAVAIYDWLKGIGVA